MNQENNINYIFNPFNTEGLAPVITFCEPL